MIKNTPQKSKSRKKNSPTTTATAAIAIATALAIAAVATGVIYIHKSQAYKSVFFPNTTINGVDASKKTIDEVKSLIASQIDGYTLTLNQRGGVTEQITKEDINLHSEFDGSLEEILSAQKPLQWWSHRKQETEHQIATMIAYDENLLQQKISSLQCFNEENIIPPSDAYISDYIPGEGYQVIPETPGNQLEQEVVEAGITLAIKNLKEELSFEELNAYVKPGITSTDETLNKVADSLNKHVNVTVTYQFGDKTEVLSGDTIHDWISVNADKTIGLDRDKVAAYVKSLADKYNTAYKKKNFKTSSGKEVTISSGFYGWRINQGAETDELYGIIRSGESQTREPVYYQRAASHGANDYGNTYVEINLTAQHLFFYKNGKLLVESDFVSGNTSKGYDTPPGAYPITYKERNATLKGEDYRTPVDYWMPFNGNIGMHDADWRSSFGGNIFKTSGSHGCVNLPPSVAKTIYENIEAGMPVLCYYLEGTDSKTTSAAPKETKPAGTAVATTAAATTKAPAETTAAPETTPAVPETSPAIPETTAAPETTAPPETTTAPETTRKANGPGDNSGGGASSEEKGPGV